MAEFCTHERHGGFCEKTETYCNLGACPYEDMKEYAPVVRCKNCKHYLGLAECEFEGHFSGGTEYYCADGERKTFDCPHCGEKDIEVNFSEVEYNTDYWGDGAVVTCPHCEKEIELGDYEYD